MTNTIKHLWVVCHGFPPYYGGAEYAAYYLARAAVRSGTKVTVITSDLGARLPARERMEEMEIVRVHTYKRHWARHTLGELAIFYWAARRWFSAEKHVDRPDYLLAHFTLPAGALARAWARYFGVPFGVVLHGSDVPGYQPDRFGWIYPLITRSVRRVWRDARPTFAVSTALRDLALGSWPGGNVQVVPNGVDTTFFCPASEPRPSSTGLRIVVVAQLIPRKGIDLLLEALSQISGTAQFHLEIYGIGPSLTALEEQARRLGLAEHVAFRGLATREHLAQAFRQSDIFALPSRQEGLPLALLEAMASGLTIVATRVGGMPTVLRDGDNARLVESDQVGGLTAVLGELASDPEQRRRLGRAARESALACGWDAIWQQYSSHIAASGHGAP